MFPIQRGNLFVNSAIWMNYVGLIGDPREPNSNSLLVCVGGGGGGGGWRKGSSFVQPSLQAVVSMADERLMAI